jgi:hypothetical protein
MVRVVPIVLDCHWDLVIQVLLEVLVVLHYQLVQVGRGLLEDQMIPQDQENLRLQRLLLVQPDQRVLEAQWVQQVQTVLENLEIRLVQLILLDPGSQMGLLGRQDLEALEDLGVLRNQYLHSDRLAHWDPMVLQVL